MAIPVPGGGGRLAGLQGFLPGQSSTAPQERISERIMEHCVRIPRGGLQGFRAGQSSSSSHFPAGIPEDVDEPGEGFFALFSVGKSAEVAGQVSAHLPWHVSSWTPAACVQPRGSDEEEEEKKREAKRKETQRQAAEAMAWARGRLEQAGKWRKRKRGGSVDFLEPPLGLRGSSEGDSRLRVRVCRRLERLLLWCHQFGGEWVFWCQSSYPPCVGSWLLQHSANSVLDCVFLQVLVVTMATFFWTCLSTRAGWRSTPLFPKWHLTCQSEVPRLQFIVQVVVFPVVAQRQIPIFGIPSCRTFGRRCSCCAASAHRSLLTCRCATTGAGWIRSAEYCGSSAVAVLRSPSTSLSWRKGFLSWSRL